MTPDCPDGLCKLKIQAIDNAIGHHKSKWQVLLSSTSSSNDVENALQFCEVFKMEARVSVTSEGYEVLARDAIPFSLNFDY
ncbi:MAG: hypothetical protein RTU30_07050 [Candidatus Thorarchaeota archaeon]